MEVTEATWRVMASRTQALLVEPHDGAVEQVRRRLDELESRWSRFLPGSDISRLNTALGGTVSVAQDTIRLIETMQLAAERTGGAYDPTHLHRLVTAGYHSSIDDADRITLSIPVRDSEHSIFDVEIDRRRRSVRMPPGLALDAGGIGKGFAADLVVTESLDAGTAGVLVSIGGDLAACGRTPTDDGWPVHVEDPFDPARPIVTIAVSAGGVATSSTRSRRWVADGREHHHVIDPTTGDESSTDLAAVTVIATAGWSAEAYATAALLAGRGRALGLLVDHGLSGVVVGADGSIRSTTDIDLRPANPRPMEGVLT